MSTNWSDIASLTTAEELAALKRLNDFYNGPAIVDWMASLWSPEIGGFYYANSARDTEGFLPDVESTVQLLRWMESNGAFSAYGKYENALPGWMKEKLVAFARSLQCEEDGYFYHPQWGKSIGTARRGRDLGWSTNLLSVLGSSPLYPTATERLAANARGDEKNANLPEWLSSKERYLEWLHEVNANMRENSGNAHGMNASCGQIIAAGFHEETFDFLDRMQKTIYEEQLAVGETPTGLWQKPVNYRAVWGLLKLAPFYGQGRGAGARPHPMRYPVEAARTCVKVILLPAAEGKYFANDVYNQWSGLGALINNVKVHSPQTVEKVYAVVREQLPDMIDNSIEKLRPFKQADGTFSYCMGHSSPTTQGVEVSLGLPEGDVNATALMCSMYRCIFTDVGLPVVPLCTPEDGERFLAAVASKSPEIKRPRPAVSE